MRDFLLQIKAVPGVKGCAVLDLGRREMHPLLPASSSGEFAERLAERLVRLADQLQPGEQVEFRFDKQACMVRRLVRGVLYVQGKAGFDMVAKKMQKAKENVSSLFPLVNELVVDQNGRVYPRKGSALNLDSSANEAFARWLAGFINLASASKPDLANFELRELTKAVAGPLDEANFYGIFKAV